MLTRTVGGRTFSYSHSIGRSLTTGIGFWFPVDVGLASGDLMYVLNWGDENLLATRVTKCTMAEEYLTQFGSYGSDDGQFTRASSLALDKEENVYVADEWLNRVSIFDKDGNFFLKWGEPGSGSGQLYQPSGLAFDGEENLLVVDSGNNRVQRFSREGKYLAKWGRGGVGEGEFKMLWGITVDRLGQVYVADWYNGRLQKFSPDGEYLMAFGAPGTGPGELSRPSGVAVDPEGDVYAVDWGANQVHVYDPDGEYLTTFHGDAQELSRWGQMTIDANPDVQKARRRVSTREPESRFSDPVAVEIDGQGRIVVVDQQRSRLQIYIKETDYVEPQFNL